MPKHCQYEVSDKTADRHTRTIIKSYSPQAVNRTKIQKSNDNFIHVVHVGDPIRGFREPGEWGPKQPGSQEQDAKMTREQGAEESNLGSMEHRVCHKIMVFHTVEIGILTHEYPDSTPQD